MAWIVFAVLLVLLLAFAGSKIEEFRARRAGDRDGADRTGFPHREAKPLLSPAERAFLGALAPALGPDYLVFAKVRVADVVASFAGPGDAARIGARGRASADHFDFVVCRASDMAALCVVDLDDRADAGGGAATDVGPLPELCQTIGLPLITLPARQAYSPDDLRRQFLAAVSPPRPPRESRQDAATLSF